MAVVANQYSALTVEALEGALREVDSAAMLVAGWLLHRVISIESGAGTLALSIPRASTHAISRERLIQITQTEELPLDRPVPDVPVVILLARPEADVLAGKDAGETLLDYWRLLFHARVKAGMGVKLAGGASAGGANSREAVQGRIEALGRAAFNEARFVLAREKYVTGAAEDAEVYAEFAAVYAELARFAPGQLRFYFPLSGDAKRVEELLGRDVDLDGLMRATRLRGSADPAGHLPAAYIKTPARGIARLAKSDAKKCARLLKRAEEADGVGNDVRAAIFRMRVYRASPTYAGNVYGDEVKVSEQLVARVKAALHLDEESSQRWQKWLAALLDNAAGGWWNAEGRLLYDLQKVCVYHEREIFSVSVVDYVLEWGKRPLRRPQAGQRLVLIVKALRSAARRVGKARLEPAGRTDLLKLLRKAIAGAEERLRDYLYEPIDRSLSAANLKRDSGVAGGAGRGPVLEYESAVVRLGATEKVAREKLLLELADGIVERGYLTFGRVRDAVSQGQLKLEDLSGAGEFFRGDQMLRLDRSLEENLDFVYHRGEFYLRAFHRLSSVLFATRAGRLITRLLILPFGGAMLILEGLDHTVGLLIHKLANHPAVEAAPATAGVAGNPPAHHPAIFNQWWIFLLVAFFLLGLINHARFRAWVGEAFGRVFSWLGVVFVDFPKWVARQPIVVAIFSSQFTRLLIRYVGKPLIFVGVTSLLLPKTESVQMQRLILGGAFLLVNVVLNSRMGRAVEQAILHAMRTTLARITWEILASFFRHVMGYFQRVLEAVDRLLYAVDELLRFRSGQSRGAVMAKAVLGVFWFFIAYLTRFVINLLVEPQINPIKHFPVVTVSHKMILPTTPYISGALQRIGIEAGRAWTAAGLITLCTPGIFGFLAWEFRSNWKLYKANRPRTIKPVRVGSHGETLATLLRPGFHSGTIPKLFHKLRRAQGAEVEALSESSKPLRALHHVEESVRVFFERDFVALLDGHRMFAELGVAVGRVRLSTTAIVVELISGARAMVLRFEQRAFWILAEMEEAGWAAELDGERSEVLSAALAGLYKMAGVDLVGAQIAGAFGARRVKFDLRRNDLLVWPGEGFETEVVYGLTDEGELKPRISAGGVTGAEDNAGALMSFRPEQLRFDRTAVEWSEWSSIWDLGEMDRGKAGAVEMMGDEALDDSAALARTGQQ